MGRRSRSKQQRSRSAVAVREEPFEPIGVEDLPGVMAGIMADGTQPAPDKLLACICEVHDRHGQQVPQEIRDAIADPARFDELLDDARAELEPGDLGEDLRAALDARATLSSWAQRGGMAPDRQLAALTALERGEVLGAFYRWTLMEGQPPQPHQWDEGAVERGWPPADAVQRLFGSFHELYDRSQVADARIIKAMTRVERLREQLSDAQRQADAKVESAQRAEAAAQRVERQRKELERRVEQLSAKADRSRDALAAERRAGAEHQAQAAKAHVALDELRTQLDAEREQREQAARERPATARLPAPGFDMPGRLVYTTWLSAGAEQFEAAQRIAAGWVARGQRSDELLAVPDGRHALDLPGPASGVEMLTFTDADDRLWQLTWTQPLGGNLALFVMADVTVARIGGAVHLGLSLRLSRPSARLTHTSWRVDPPTLPARWLTQIDARDGGVRLRDTPQPIGPADLPGVAALVAHHDRRRPVVVAGGGADALAGALAGCAHVLRWDDRHRLELADALGIRHADPHSAYLIWPGAICPLTAPDLHVVGAESGADDAVRSLVDRTFGSVRDAAIIGLPAPDDVRALRRRALRPRAQADVSAAEWEALAEEAIAEADELRSGLEQAQRREQELLRRLDQAQRDARAAAYDAPPPAVTAADAPPARADDVWNGLAERLDALPEVASVAEATAVAAECCRNLTFADRAHSSAADSPYRQPERVLEDLVKLDRVAELYRQGSIGRSLADVAGELGLDWVEDSSAARRGRTAKEYRFTHAGRDWVLRPHLRVGGRACGAGAFARIYFALHKGDDQTGRALIVGHVGRKLPDSTT